jgi:hypothetical protein
MLNLQTAARRNNGFIDREQRIDGHRTTELTTELKTVLRGAEENGSCWSGSVPIRIVLRLDRQPGTRARSPNIGAGSTQVGQTITLHDRDQSVTRGRSRQDLREI